MAVRDKADQLFYEKNQLGLCVCVVRECVQHECECVGVRWQEGLLHCGAESQMVSVNGYYPTKCVVVAIKREGLLSSDYATVSLSHTHTYLHSLTLLHVH